MPLRAKPSSSKARAERTVKRAIARVDAKQGVINQPHPGSSILFDWNLANKILEGVAKGETLTAVCERLDICETTVRNWALDDRGADNNVNPPVMGFGESFLRAEHLQAEAWADECIKIADNVFADANDIAKAKFRVDVRKYLMERKSPRFASKPAVAVINEGDKIVKFTLNIFEPRGDEQPRLTNGHAA